MVRRSGLAVLTCLSYIAEEGDCFSRHGYQTLDQRNGYVEAKAAVNDSWIARLLRELVQGWTERETSTVHHLGLSLMQGLAK